MSSLVVLDTNIFINAIFDKRNHPNDMIILRLESQKKIQLAFSKYSLDELFKIMSRFVNDDNIFECSDFFRNLGQIANRSVCIDIPVATRVVSNDASDQNFVDLAVEVGADYFITNDLASGILQQKGLNGVKFRNPYQFVSEFYSKQQTAK